MRKKNIGIKYLAAGALLCGALLLGSDSAEAAVVTKNTAQAEQRFAELSFEPSRFVLPEDARALVVVEGFAVNGGRGVYQAEHTADPKLWNRARVTVFTKNTEGGWTEKIQSAAVYGWGGMSNHRHSGDGSTPIGLWKADTPFGLKAAESGFPADYIQISRSARNQFWSDLSNRLETNDDIAAQKGEQLWADWATTIYDYALNSGFNRDRAQPGTGTALFLHCTKAGKPSTAGCVAMDPEAMKGILRLYARGGLYVAQAPESQFESVYTAYSETGAAAAGEFRASWRQLPETRTIVLE